jgi:hypothetical protein
MDAESIDFAAKFGALVFVIALLSKLLHMTVKALLADRKKHMEITEGNTRALNRLSLSQDKLTEALSHRPCLANDRAFNGRPPP